MFWGHKQQQLNDETIFNFDGRISQTALEINFFSSLKRDLWSEIVWLLIFPRTTFRQYSN